MGPHLGRPTPPTVASSRGRVGIPRFRLLLRCPKSEETFLCQISLHVGAQIHPTPLLLFTEVMGHPAGTTFPYAKAVAKNASETSRWNLHDILYLSVCHFWVLLNQGLYPRDVFWGNGRCHSTITVIVFQRSRSRHELSKPTENSGFGRRLISKTVFQTLKALLERFSLAVVIIHHSSSRKANTAGRRPVSLTGHFVAWNENGCTELSKNCCHKYYEIGLWCNVKSKVVTSLVRLGWKT